MKAHNVGRGIETALDREDWDAARDLILGALKNDPDNHWLLDRLSITYYEQRRYGKALTLIKKAYQLAPHCPLVLWDYAGSLNAVGKPRAALKIYSALIKKGPRALCEMEPCGEGREWALGLVTDCLYRAGVCWEHLGKKQRAVRWLKAFLQARSECPESIYSPDDALKHIEKLSNGNLKHMEDELGVLTKNLLTMDAKPA